MESVLPRSSIEPVGSSKRDHASKVLSRLKSGPDYTRLPLIAMENMKFGPGSDADARSVWVPLPAHDHVTLGKSRIG
jgi:hypothetical protein